MTASPSLHAAPSRSPHALEGWISGALGVIIFSGSLPATRLAVEGFSPLFLTSARAVIAALVGGLLLLGLRQPRPALADIPAFLCIALGAVVGFPLLTALALQHITAAHSVVFVGLLPLATAAFGVLRGGERPSPLFWVFSVLGAAVLMGFSLSRDAGGGSLVGDGLMVVAIILCGWAYAEGAILTKRYGGWQVISWALLLALPVMGALMLWSWPASFVGVPASAWWGLGYVSLFSMMLGFVFWYHGLALGGTTGVGQLQLFQSFLGLALSAWLLGDHIGPEMWIAVAGVVLCVTLAKRYA